MAKAICCLLFFTPLLLEGLGLGSVHQYILYYYFVLPFLLYLYVSFLRIKLVFPHKASLAFFLFIFFSLLSALFFSVDKQASFEHVLFYTASFLLFIFFYNLKKEGERLIKLQVIVGSVIFAFYSLIVHFTKNTFLVQLFPQNSYQMIQSYFYFSSHNHLGDFIGLTMIISLNFVFLKRSLRDVFIFLFSLPFFLFSFSRSSYIAFLITLAFLLLNLKKAMSKTISKMVLITFTALSIVILTYFFLTVKEAQNSQVFKPFYTILTNVFHLQPKDFFAQRPEYFYQGFQSFYEKPFFGVGLHNFIYASTRYASQDWLRTETSHNLFLEILVENGLFAFLAFAGFVLIILKQGFKKPSLYFFLFLYLLLNFQTDYTYRIYSFFILFMSLAGIFYEEKKELNLSWLYGISSLLLFLVLEIIVATFMLQKAGYYRYALTLYPLNKLSYPILINEGKNQGNSLAADNLAKRYEFVAPFDLNTLEFLARFYEKSSNKKETLRIYEKMLLISPHSTAYLKEKIEALKKD